MVDLGCWSPAQVTQANQQAPDTHLNRADDLPGLPRLPMQVSYSQD